MNTVILIIGIIFLVTSIICFAIISIKSTSKLSKIDSIFIIMIIIGTVLFMYATDDSPKPIDVYRNKTILQITYKVQGLDTLSRDTLVVWK